MIVRHKAPDLEEGAIAVNIFKVEKKLLWLTDQVEPEIKLLVMHNQQAIPKS